MNNKPFVLTSDEYLAIIDMLQAHPRGPRIAKALCAYFELENLGDIVYLEYATLISFITAL